MERDSLAIQQVSYLIARDPSILSFNGPYFPKTKLDNEFVEDSPETDNHVQVHLRLKHAPDFSELYEICGTSIICKVPDGSHFLRNVRDGDSLRKTFTFSKIFGPEATQNDVFNQIVKSKMYSFINGQNSTLMTYGASGSGKTFTVIGTAEEPGLVPRSLVYLFRTLKNTSRKLLGKPLPTGEVIWLSREEQQAEQDFRKSFLSSSYLCFDRTQHAKTYKAMQQRLSKEPAAICESNSDVVVEVWVSFAEIYNEQIYDLLEPPPARGKQRTRLRLGSSQNNTYIKNLTTVNVSSGLEAYQILQYGLQHLNYASTKLNSHSSRSHSIFTVKLLQISQKDGGAYISNFNFCDLAGSERSKKTMNVGDRLKESNNINSSLLVLGRCINTVRDGQKQKDSIRVPYRESKLTQLFQKALSGQEDISLVVNINPTKSMFDESQHVLNFAAIAKDITIEQQPEISRPIKNNRFSQYIQQSRNAVADSNVADTTETELEKYRSAVLYLESELENQKFEYEENARINRERIINGYKEIIKQKEQDTKERIRKAELAVERHFHALLESQKNFYTSELNKLRPAKDVIDLDSSSEDDEDQFERLRQEVLSLKAENKKLKEDHEELAETLKDAESEYNEWERALRLKDKEILDLKERCNELETELSITRRDLLSQRREIDQRESENDDNSEADDLSSNKEKVVPEESTSSQDPIIEIAGNVQHEDEDLDKENAPAQDQTRLLDLDITEHNVNYLVPQESTFPRDQNNEIADEVQHKDQNVDKENAPARTDLDTKDNGQEENHHPLTSCDIFAHKPNSPNILAPIENHMN